MKKYIAACVLGFVVSGAPLAFAQSFTVPSLSTYTQQIQQSTGIVVPSQITQGAQQIQQYTQQAAQLAQQATQAQQSGQTQQAAQLAQQAQQATQQAQQAAQQAQQATQYQQQYQQQLAQAQQTQQQTQQQYQQAQQQAQQAQNNATYVSQNSGGSNTTQSQADPTADTHNGTFDHRLSCPWLSTNATVDSCRQMIGNSSTPY